MPSGRQSQNTPRGAGRQPGPIRSSGQMGHTTRRCRARGGRTDSAPPSSGSTAGAGIRFGPPVTRVRRAQPGSCMDRRAIVLGDEPRQALLLWNLPWFQDGIFLKTRAWRQLFPFCFMTGLRQPLAPAPRHPAAQHPRSTATWSLRGCPQPCGNTQTPSRGEAKGVPSHPTDMDEFCIPLCDTRSAWAAGAHHHLRHRACGTLKQAHPTSSSRGKASHHETVGFPWCFLPSRLLDASSLCLTRLFHSVQPPKCVKGIISHQSPEPTIACLHHRAGNLPASCSFWSSPETAHGQAMAPVKARGGSEDRHRLHGASGKGIFPRKAAGVCPSPSDIPSKRPL